MFPLKTKILKRPIGWVALGAVEDVGNFDEKLGKTMITFSYHSFCGTRVHIGKEEDKLFSFCPRCLIKIKRTET